MFNITKKTFHNDKKKPKIINQAQFFSTMYKFYRKLPMKKYN